MEEKVQPLTEEEIQWIREFRKQHEEDLRVMAESPTTQERANKLRMIVKSLNI